MARFLPHWRPDEGVRGFGAQISVQPTEITHGPLGPYRTTPTKENIRKHGRNKKGGQQNMDCFFLPSFSSLGEGFEHFQPQQTDCI